MNQESSFGEFDPTGELSQARENLEATRAALKAKTPKTRKYREARSDMCVQLLSEAGSAIKNAAGILERNPELKGGDSFTAFEMCLLVSFRNLQLALRDAAVVKGTRDWRAKKKGGDIRAEILHRNKKVLAELYERFAPRRDAMGWARPSDIYNDFEGRCIDAGIKVPPENTFRTRLARTRKNLGLT